MGAFDHLPTLDGHLSQGGRQRCECGAPLVPYSLHESDLVCYASGKGCCLVSARRDPRYGRRRWRSPEYQAAAGVAGEVAWVRGVYWRELATQPAPSINDTSDTASLAGGDLCLTATL